MKILIADDHPLVRDALARTLQTLDQNIELIEADSLASLFDSVAMHRPDLALIDLNMPGMNGIEGLRKLRAAHPTLPVVVASGQDDPATIRAVMATGVSGFIPKRESRELLQQAIRLVMAGGVYVPVRSLASDDRAPPSLAALNVGQPGQGLTPRQLDVLGLLLRGLPNKLIARELGLTEGTVKIHLAAILRALQVRNRTEAVVRARELGILSAS